MAIPTNFPKHLSDMLNPDFYPHEVNKIDVMETHISWVILAGNFVYKIKKEIKLDFLDFSTLEQRRHFCLEELRLNARFAPEYYLGVEAIKQKDDGISFQHQGKVIEYALKMKRFPDHSLLNQLILDNRFTTYQLDELATSIANIHLDLPKIEPHSELGSYQTVLEAALDNFTTLEKLVTHPEDLKTLLQLKNWTQDFTSQSKKLFELRKTQGFIRECHGDLHLGNITVVNQKVIAFDCIEFNEQFRWIDVMNDIAFLVMDLHHHQRPDLARRLLNQYLEVTGDYQGLKLIKFYLVYRALVRCKVAAIQHQQQPETQSDTYQSYLHLAQQFTQQTTPKLLITHGLSGSGKTLLSQLIIENSHAIRIRSDVERKRLFGLSALEKSSEDVKKEMYSAQANQRTYERLASLAENVITSGHHVIIDATFLKKNSRDFFHQFATQRGIDFVILHTHAPIPQLKKWIKERQAQGKDASEATVNVLQQQLTTQDELSTEEKKHTVLVHTEHPIDIVKVIEKAHL